MNDIYRTLKIMKENKQTTFALATIVAVEGSSYRHPGAKMLIGEDGSQYGMISAGCLEEDLALHALDVIRNRQPKTLVYDLSSEDDLSWGRGAGCNGRIKLFVEPSEWDCKPLFHNEPIWPQVESMLNSGYKIASVKRISGNDADSVRLFYCENGAVVGDAEQSMKESIVRELKRFIETGQKIKITKPAHSESELLFELYEPRERLYLFGAGPDAEPLARLAADLDFFVTVIDPRSGRCNEAFFPAAHQLIVEHPECYLQHNRIPGQSFVVIMTHNFQRDRQILRSLIQSPPRYLGVLGARLRTERLLSPDSLPDWIHSPIGLRIGAEGPDEISVSVLAELIQFKNRL